MIMESICTVSEVAVEKMSKNKFELEDNVSVLQKLLKQIKDEDKLVQKATTKEISRHGKKHKTNLPEKSNTKGSKGKYKLRSVKKPKMNGITNMGTTCFLSSAIVAISSLPKLRNFIMKEEYLISIDRESNSQGIIHDALSDLLKRIWCEEIRDVYPRKFMLKVVDTFMPIFSNGMQDSSEFLISLLNLLQAETRSDRFGQTIYRDFYGILDNSRHCTSCGHLETNEDKFLVISRSLPKRATIYEVLQETPSIIEGYICKNCQDVSSKNQQSIIKNIGRYFLLNLNRYVYLQDGAVQKTEGKLMNSMNATLQCKSRSMHMNLTAFIVHIGETPQSGHYIAVFQHENRWVKANDQKCTFINESAVQKLHETAYLYIYSNTNKAQQSQESLLAEQASF